MGVVNNLICKCCEYPPPPTPLSYHSYFFLLQIIHNVYLIVSILFVRWRDVPIFRALFLFLVRSWCCLIYFRECCTYWFLNTHDLCCTQTKWKNNGFFFSLYCAIHFFISLVFKRSLVMLVLINDGVLKCYSNVAISK